MRISRSRVVTTAVLAATAASLIAVVSCYTPTDPYYTDIDAAHEVWLESHPSDYTFEVQFSSAMSPASGYYRVHVADRVVVRATDSAGRAVKDFSVTVDTVWEWLLASRARGELNSAHFNEQGVPVDVDLGRWELDSGWHSSVRKFERLR